MIKTKQNSNAVDYHFFFLTTTALWETGTILTGIQKGESVLQIFDFQAAEGSADTTEY